MPILTKSGRVAIAESIAARALHLAWGTGDGSWVTPPSESNNATALLNEIGRRTVTEVIYVVPDVAGEIVLPSGKFSPSATPTNNLCLTINFDFSDAPSQVIREAAVFSGTVTNPALPLGQKYFAPGDLVNVGRMVHIENIAPLFRSPAVKESFVVVITF